MIILTILACFWGFMFVLALALVTANRRVALVDEPTTLDFQASPILAGQPEELASFGEIAVAKLGTPTERRAKRLAGEKETIFVVDDDPDILNLLKHVLALEGFNIRAFTNPEEALEEFTNTHSRPRMVVTDFCMQPMNGLELIHRCRQTDPELKTIVISGMVDEQALARNPERTNGFLAKPFKVANLVQTLNTTLAEVQN